MRETRAWTQDARHGVAALFAILLIAAPTVARAQSVTAAWDPSPPSDQVTSYQVCIGTSSMTCDQQLASVNSTYYTFSPTPGALHYVAVRAINSLGAGPYSAEVSFSIPSLAPPGNQAAYAGVPVAPLNLSAVDPDGSPLTFTHTGLPVGLSLNSSTGQITGTPTSAGTYNVTVFVSDGLVTASQTFTWSVNLGVSAVSVGPNSGTNIEQTFVLQYSDAIGIADLESARVRFVSTSAGGPGSGANSCTVSYAPATGATSLMTDGGGAWQNGQMGSGTLSNGQCTINLAGSSASASGNDLTLSLAVTFTSGFAGSKNIYMLARNLGGASTGWQHRGSWTVPTGPVGEPSVVSVTPDTGSGSSATFTLLYSDTEGATDLATAKVRFVPTSVGGQGTNAGVCQASYNRSANTLSLQNDTGTSPQVGTLGSGGTLFNSQCTINLAGSSVSISGDNLTLTLSVTFTGSFAGDKNIYMRATTANANTGWQQRGTWTVPPPAGGGAASNVSVTPDSGSGSSGTFSFLYSDTAGATDLDWVKVRFGATSSTNAGTCTLSYDPAGNSLSLMNDAGSGWQAGTLGSGTLSNSQCTIDLAASAVTVNGNDLTLSVAAAFSPSFAGAKNTYMRAKTVGGQNTGWQQRGSWTVPTVGTNGTPSTVSVSPNFASGSGATYVLQYGDTGGAADLESARVRFVAANLASPGSGVNTCTVSYDQTTGSVSLMNDAATAWQSGTLGSGSLSNSQCTVNLAGASVSVSGNNLTLSLPITFNTSSFNGGKRIYMLAKTLAGTSTGWQLRGAYLVQ